MIKKILLLFVLLFSFNLCFGAENTQTKINTINYTGNLNKDSIIKVLGTNFQSCEYLKIGNTQIETKSFSNYQITYEFSKYDDLSGTFSMLCDGEIIKKSFEFPYIESVSGINELQYGGNISIYGKNFGNSGTISVKGGTFKSTSYSNDLIMGKFSEKIESNEIYLQSKDGLKSNVFTLNIGIPHIDYIVGEDNFKKNSYIFIYGKYLNENNNSIIYYGDEELLDYTYNSKDGFIKVKIGDKTGKKKIKVKSNGILTNEIQVTVIGDTPYIKDIIIKNYETENNGVKTTKKRLYIYGNNFGESLTDILVYQNKKQIKPSFNYGDELVFDSYDLLSGNNFFQINLNGQYSNTKDYFVNYTLPSIGSVDIGSIEDNYRIFTLYISNYDETKDKIYLDKSEVKPISCYGNSCRFKISKNILSGTFISGNGIVKNKEGASFDIKFSSTPNIEYVKFYGDLKQGTKVIIKGSNFLNSSISITNLFGKKENGKPDIEISDSEIEGRVAYDYDSSKSTSISISNYGLNTSISFIGGKLETDLVYGSPIINKVYSLEEDNIIRKSAKLKITGKGFNNGDIINIGGYKIPLVLDKTSKGIGTFYLPEDISEGLKDFYIENKDGNKSSKFQLIILPYSSTYNIDFKEEQLEYKEFETNKDYTKEKLYSLNITNKIEDITINSISFKITTDNKNIDIRDFGTFILKLDGQEIGTSMVDKNGILKFDSRVVLNKKSNDYNLALYQNSRFYQEGDYHISLIESSLSSYNNETYKAFQNFNYNNLIGRSLKIIIENSKSCYDYESSNKSCNMYLSSLTSSENTQDNVNTTIKDDDNLIKNTQKVTIIVKTTTNETKTLEDKKKNIDLKLEKFYAKLSVNSLKFQLDFLNKFKSNIEKYLKLNIDEDKRELLNSINTNITSKYNKLVKEYILSKNK